MAYYGQNFEYTGHAQDNHIMAMGNLNKSMETKPMTCNTLVVVGKVFLFSFRLPMTIL